MARLLPLPTDVFRKVDDMLETVEATLERVDGTLVSVDTTLGTGEATLADATAVLTQVKGLLAELQDELELLHQVPALAAQLDLVHRTVTALAVAQGVEVPKAPGRARAAAGSAPRSSAKPRAAT